MNIERLRVYSIDSGPRTQITNQQQWIQWWSIPITRRSSLIVPSARRSPPVTPITISGSNLYHI
jgi:hypothetical protein